MVSLGGEGGRGPPGDRCGVQRMGPGGRTPAGTRRGGPPWPPSLLLLLRLGGLLLLGHDALAGRLQDARGDAVGVAVRRRAAVLHVALAVLLGVARDADRRAAVGDAVLEVVDAAGLVLARKALVVALAVLRDVLLRDLPERLADLQDDFVAAVLAHGGDGEVRVATRAVPVALLR